MDKITHESISIPCPAECEDGEVSQYDGEYYTTCERCKGNGIIFVIEESKVQAQVDEAVREARHDELNKIISADEHCSDFDSVFDLHIYAEARHKQLTNQSKAKETE